MRAILEMLKICFWRKYKPRLILCIMTNISFHYQLVSIYYQLLGSAQPVILPNLCSYVYEHYSLGSLLYHVEIPTDVSLLSLAVGEAARRIF